MTERRPWTKRLNRRLPLRFQDVTPQPAPPLLQMQANQPNTPENASSVCAHKESNNVSGSSLSALIPSRLRRIFRTPRNVFGLSRHYESTEPPSYDPEEHLSLQDLSNIPVCADPTETDDVYYPFPNQSAFLLAEWHWNGGEQKSRASFHSLMEIIGNPKFQSTDIRGINWDRINEELGTGDDEAEWLDDDAGWSSTPVTISVPYQSRRGVPSEPGAGPRNYTVEDFYHRSLVSIIKEKISGLKDAHQFHFEPYEQHWQRNDDVDPIRTQGELYTSPAFIDAHRELQDSPAEPGCDLPRVIVALMFWSDATQLTSFGNTKLWPLYLFIGNESKYRRCKPTSHLCDHVAYFRIVSDFY
jgi:hypothetical protein